MELRGIFVASVTAVSETGSLDPVGQAKLLAWFESAGLTGAVLGGTNGEGPSLSAVDKRDLVRAAQPGAGILKIIAGLATNSLSEAIWLAQQAHKVGAVASLTMPPSYFKEVAELQIRDWFLRLMDATGLPCLVYNFPRRVGFSLSPNLLHDLCDHPNFLGAKDSSGETENLVTFREAVGPTKHLFVGDETLLVEAHKSGWNGSISGVANSIPGWLVDIWNRLEASDPTAEPKFEALVPIIRGLRSLPQPATHKAILHRLGILPDPALIPPLGPASPEQVAQAFAWLEKLGIRPA